jgi:hypothetical protein
MGAGSGRRRVKVALATVGLLGVMACGCDVAVDFLPQPTLGGEGWEAQAVEHRGANGMVFRYECPPNGTLATVWGTDIYTDDSSVCTAGVHAGVITQAAGGTVRIVIRPGLAAYNGTSRNGITTERWAEPWHGSFVVVNP